MREGEGWGRAGGGGLRVWRDWRGEGGLGEGGCVERLEGRGRAGGRGVCGETGGEKEGWVKGGCVERLEGRRRAGRGGNRKKHRIGLWVRWVDGARVDGTGQWCIRYPKAILQ